MTIFLLIRHASNDFLKEGRLAGRTPGVHINALGQREAEDLARRLAQLPIEAVYSSPLERAYDTALVVAQCHKLPVHLRQGLLETEAGEWTGRKIDELKDTDTWKAIQQRPVGVKLPGGESIDQVQRRMVGVIEEIRKAHPDGVVAVVSHADPIKALIAHYLCLDLNSYQRLVVNPASVSVLAISETGGQLLSLNDTGSLPKFEKLKSAKNKTNGAQEGDQLQMPAAAADKDQTKMTETNIVHDLNPVSRLTVGAIGEPGHRTFFLQARGGMTLVTLLAEKDQMTSLGQGITDLLLRLGERVDAPTNISEYDLALEEPLEPLFRIGQLGLGYDKESDQLVIVAYAATMEEEPESVDVVRFWASRDQMRALARHVVRVAAAGRPTCVLCGKPIDPGGHFCPRRNGHGEHAQLA